MRFAISFIVLFVVALAIIAVGWRHRPATRPSKVSIFGWATLVIGAAAALAIVPSVTAPYSLVLVGVGLVTGALALIRRDTHQWTIVGQTLVGFSALFWLVFLGAELIFPHA